MASIDTWAIRSRRVLLPDGLREAAVVVRGERIERVVPPEALEPGLPVEDAGDDVVLPGLVDSHVHVNEPGRTEWEGFETATRAAAAGGVTAIVDMPLNSMPVTTTARAFERKREAAEGKLHVDVGFWGGVVPGNAAELGLLGRAGALGAKAFLCHSGIDDFPMAAEADLREAMPAMERAGLPLLAHAELEVPAALADEAAAKADGDPRRYETYLASRPKAWEDAAMALLVRLCRATRCRVHVVHLSSASAIPILRDARAEGLPITVETCPHYLCLESEEIPDGDTRFKCAPPIREHANREALWAALAEGVIDFVVSDHSPCTPELKKLERGDFMAAWGGIASLQLALPALYTEAKRRGIGLERVAQWLSHGPAAFAGIADRKGGIAPGLDADLVVWDPDAAFRVEEHALRFRNKVSPYLGRELSGRVLATWVRGRKVFDGEGFAAGAAGRMLLHRSEGARR